MLVCSAHGSDDPVAARSGRAPSQAQGPGSAGRDVTVRLPHTRDPGPCGTPDDRGVAGSPEPSRNGAPYTFARQGRSRGAGRALIVVDASAVIEVLLGTSVAERLAERLFAEGETLHAPHLLD